MNPIPLSLTLEIGSGSKPDFRSDILVDKHLFNSNEREGKLFFDRPLIIADGEALPFRSKSFSFIIARHVLEHAFDPVKFLEEMERVGKKGYIETPSPIAEKIFNWPFHRWFVSQKDNILIIKEKKEEDNQLGSFFHFLTSSHLSVRLFIRFHRELFYTQFFWNGHIIYSLESTEKTSNTNFLKRIEMLDDTELNEQISILRTKERHSQLIPFAIKFFKKTIFYFYSLRVKLRHLKYNFQEILSKILCCPLCKDEGELIKRDNEYICCRCHASFPIISNIPIFNKQQLDQ